MKNCQLFHSTTKNTISKICYIIILKITMFLVIKINNVKKCQIYILTDHRLTTPFFYFVRSTFANNTLQNYRLFTSFQKQLATYKQYHLSFSNNETAFESLYCLHQLSFNYYMFVAGLTNIIYSQTSFQGHLYITNQFIKGSLISPINE